MSQDSQITVGPGYSSWGSGDPRVLPSTAAMPSSMSLPSMPISPRIQGHRVRRRWDNNLPPSLRPLVRAYLLAYASVVAPRVVSLLAHHLTGRYRHIATAKKEDRRPQTPLLVSLRRILRDALHWQRFPTFCAVLVAGSTWLEVCEVTPTSCASHNLPGPHVRAIFSGGGPDFV